MHRHKPPPSRRTVISCTDQHLPAIRAIYNHSILHSTALFEYEPRSEETMQEWFSTKQRDGTPVLGIEWEPGVLAGFVTWGPFRQRAAYKYSAEHSVYVDERFRGQGIGRQLLAEIVAAARRHDLHMLIAGIDGSNTASIALHKSLGFRCSGLIREAGFKFGRWLDLEFWQMLLDTPAEPVDG